MKPEMILQADILDILFENRNKAYGAYELRKDYNGRLYKAMGVMVGMVLLFIVFNYWKNDSSSPAGMPTINIPPDIIINQVDIIKPAVVDLPKPPPASIQYTTPIITGKAEATIPENTDLDKDVNIGTQNIEGPPASEDPVTPHAENIGNVIEPKVTEDKEPPVYFSAQVMPEYPGGETSMRRFLQHNLRFDFEGQEPGSQVLIKCRFIVDKEGNVTAIEIVKSGGRLEYDKEVTRVVTKMPAWKPGFQNGKNVSVYFTLPVVVEVPEQ